MKSPGSSLETVIVVDDDVTCLIYASAILHNSYNILSAQSAENLFKILEKKIPTLILLDIMMPGTDGFEVNARLKQDEKTKNIPVIFMTGMDGQASEVRALREGAVDYITKPFSVEVLRMRIGVHVLLQKQKRELLESAKIAEIANNAKSDFIATMSHEMRTPLNAIIGFSELSLEDNETNNLHRRNLLNIKNAGVTLLKIISDILDISKIETGNLDLIPVEYDSASLINDAITQSILHKAEKPINFNLVISPDFPAKLFGDEIRVKQVLNNLLTNAFKFTSEGEVALSLESEVYDDTIVITATVSDTGMGIKPKNLKKVFDDYVQADMSANRKIVGTGLGLSISKRLTTMMGGDIDVSSKYGVGSTFTAHFRQKFVSSEPISAAVIESLKKLRYVELIKHLTENLPRLSLPYARILVVDDMEANLLLAEGFLKRYNIKSDCVSSGLEAIKAIKNGDLRYNAIFMDHMMPEMDGIQATRLIREIGSDYAKEIPVIAFTANAIVGNREMFLNAGFQDFISKPVELHDFDALIKDMANKGHFGAQEEYVENNDSASDISILDFNVEGVDFKKGVDRFVGDNVAYINILRSFAKNIPSILEKVRQVPDEDFDEYVTLVHGIRGSCYGICADSLADLADALEIAAKAGDYEFVHCHNADFVEETQRILLDITDVIAQIEGSKQKECKAEPDRQLLEKLLDSCKRHDMNGIDAIVEELDAFSYEAEGELVAWLKEMSDEMNYGDIVERLEASL